MGAGCLLGYSDPDIDVPAVVGSGRPADQDLTTARLTDLFPGCSFEPLERFERGAIGAAAWPGIFLIDPYVGLLDSHPDQVDPAWLTPGIENRIAYVDYQSVVDAVGVAIWEPGNVLSRCILFADDEIQHSSGEPAGFEVPFWSGERNPVNELGERDYGPEYTIAFDWMDYRDTACKALFGLEMGDVNDRLHWFRKS